MAADHGKYTAEISIPGISTAAELTLGDAQLYDDQERRAQAIERAAAALVDADAGTVLAVAEYVISGSILGFPAG